MVLRVRIRSARLFKDLTTFSRMTPYVVLLGAANKLQTVSIKEGGKQPVWEQYLTFPCNPPNIKLEVWIEHPNGDMLAGEVLIDLHNFYQREPYRIQPKTINLVNRKQVTGQIKVQLDFDYDGMPSQQLKRIKSQGLKQQGRSNSLQHGTVIAVGRKELTKKQDSLRLNQQINKNNDRPYQKPLKTNDYYPQPQKKKPEKNVFQDRTYYNIPNPYIPKNGNNTNCDNAGINLLYNWKDDKQKKQNVLNNNQQEFVIKNKKKQYAKNKQEQKRPSDDPWSLSNDPYGNNGGWDI